MMWITYITAILAGLGIICIILPKKFYTKSQFNFKFFGVWLLLLSISAQCSFWIFYGLFVLIKNVLFLYKIAWGFAI